MDLDSEIKKWSNIAKLSAFFSAVYGLVFLVFIQTRPGAVVLIALLVATIFFCDKAAELKKRRKEK